MKTLHLNLKKKWFDMIASGEKTTEYRQTSEYWEKRLFKKYDTITFSNGYSKNRRQIIIQFEGIGMGTGRLDWGATSGVCYYKIRLGKIINKNF